MQVTCRSIINGPLRHAAQIIRARLPHALCGLPVRLLYHFTYHTSHADSSQMDP